MDKHTPGPWSVWPDRNGYLRIGHGPNCSVAQVFEPPIGFREHNARLIAAATDLLAFIEEMENAGGFGTSWHSRMRALIAKSTGEDQ